MISFIRKQTRISDKGGENCATQDSIIISVTITVTDLAYKTGPHSYMHRFPFEIEGIPANDSRETFIEQTIATHRNNTINLFPL